MAEITKEWWGIQINLTFQVPKGTNPKDYEKGLQDLIFNNAPGDVENLSLRPQTWKLR